MLARCAAMMTCDVGRLVEARQYKIWGIRGNGWMRRSWIGVEGDRVKLFSKEILRPCSYHTILNKSSGDP